MAWFAVTPNVSQPPPALPFPFSLLVSVISQVPAQSLPVSDAKEEFRFPPQRLQELPGLWAEPEGESGKHF